jgi:hypothetical protein
MNIFYVEKFKNERDEGLKPYRLWPNLLSWISDLARHQFCVWQAWIGLKLGEDMFDKYHQLDGLYISQTQSAI